MAQPVQRRAGLACKPTHEEAKVDAKSLCQEASKDNELSRVVGSTLRKSVMRRLAARALSGRAFARDNVGGAILKGLLMGEPERRATGQELAS